MGETTTRHFRDKLAMRVKAAGRGLPVPAFVHVLNDERLRDFCERVPPPWILKPRHMAGAIGIRKIHGEDEMWAVTEALGDERSYYLLEQFVPGDVYHVDSIVSEREVLVGDPEPVRHAAVRGVALGGVFTTRVLDRVAPRRASCSRSMPRAASALGSRARCVAYRIHPRRRRPVRFSRNVGARRRRAHRRARRSGGRRSTCGPSGRRSRLAGGKSHLHVPPMPRGDYAGLIVSLARQESPDTAAYADPEVVWRLTKPHHAGLDRPLAERRNASTSCSTQYTDAFPRGFRRRPSRPASTPFD